MEKERSSDIIEKHLCKAVMAGDYPIGSPLPSERELAKEFGVGRPTIREALQRLGRDGWLTIRQGQPAVVNDYWHDGNLTTLAHIIQNHDFVSDEFIVHLLEIRKSLTPTYVHDAVEWNRPKVVALLADLDQLNDDSNSYANYDWNLQKGLAVLSPNPVYLLILNSFNSFYIKMAQRYFSTGEHRRVSLEYYQDLLAASLNGTPEEAEKIAKEAMEKSLMLWKNRSEKTKVEAI